MGLVQISFQVMSNFGWKFKQVAVAAMSELWDSRNGLQKHHPRRMSLLYLLMLDKIHG